MTRILSLAVFIILSIILTLRFSLFFSSQIHYKDNQKISFETTLLSEPQVFGMHQMISANLPRGERVFITTARFPEFSYAQTLRISGTIRVLPRARPAELEAHEVRPYGISTQEDRVLDDRKSILTMYFPKISAKGGSSSGREANPIESESDLIGSGLAVIQVVRQKIIDFFNHTLPATSASLLLGIVFGITSQMPSGFKDDLRLSGVLHVVAASGMNVTLVASFLSSIFSVFFRRQIALVFTFFGIWFYALLAGFEASIVRASLMGTLVFSAQILGKQYLAVLGLFVAAYVMLFISPMVLFDIGFQLSFAATLGLILLPKIGVIRGIREIRIIGEDVSITIAAQIATLPILLTTFGTYSLWSVVVNALILWTIPILMVLGGIGAIGGIIHPLIGKVFLYLCLPFLLYFEKIVSYFAGLGGILQMQNFPWQLTIGYYALLIAGLVYVSEKK